MKMIMTLLSSLIIILPSFTPIEETFSQHHQVAFAADQRVQIQPNQPDETKTLRYRSGRRSFTPTPSTGYRAPARSVPPASQIPGRRTGGLFGGMGSFLAGTFLGSMLFGSPFGGYGGFSFFRLIIDFLVVYFIFKLVKGLLWKFQKR